MIIVGKIGSPHGIKGWMKLFSFTQPATNLEDYAYWYIQIAGQWRLFKKEEIQFQLKSNTQKGLYIKISGCDTPEQARFYSQASIGVERSQLPELGVEDYYWSDLEGLEVINQSGKSLGKVSHLLETGSNDVLVVVGDRERLIPCTRQFMLKVDSVKRQILVDWDPDF